MSIDPAANNRIENLNVVFSDLKLHLEKAHRLVSGEKSDPLRYKELAGYLCAIRSLLKELQEAACSPLTEKGIAATIQELRDRYSELEGLVKEKRNDLLR